MKKYNIGASVPTSNAQALKSGYRHHGRNPHQVASFLAGYAAHVPAPLFNEFESEYVDLVKRFTLRKTRSQH